MKFPIKSVLEQISATVFKMTCLNEAKIFTLNFIQDKDINEKDKLAMINEINNIKSLVRFQIYIANSLLKYEGMGMNQIRKTAREAAHDDTNTFG